jgi:hypothetical protein
MILLSQLNEWKFTAVGFGDCVIWLTTGGWVVWQRQMGKLLQGMSLDLK